MDQPGRRRRCGGGEIALLQQKHPQAASRGVARQADAVEPAADNSQIVVRHAGDSVSRVMSALHLQRFQAKWRRLAKENALEHDVIRWNRHHALALRLSMISAQTRSAFVAR